MRYGIRWLLLLLLLCACGMGWWRADTNRREKLQHATRALQTFVDGDSSDFSRNLVRAVNHVQALGEEDARAVLSQWFPTFSDESNVSNAAARLPRSPQFDRRISFVLSLLFERRDPTCAACPDLRLIWFDHFEGVPPDHIDFWDTRPIVENDIPFFVFNPNFTGGFALGQGIPNKIVEWASIHGRICQSPLAPNGDPFEAADTVLKNLQDKQDFWKHPDAARIFRKQVLSMVSHLIPTAEYTDSEFKSIEDADEHWQTLKEAVQALDLYWDTRSQRYEARNK